MNVAAQLDLRGRKYFLTPVCLVPNGRAHLGHIAGPLLKLDVLRRHLLCAGADVRMISLSDVHESHVAIRAHQNGSTPEEVANRFHELICSDLATLGIEYDDLINPLDASWAARYDHIVRDLVSRLVDADSAEVRRDSLPHVVAAEEGEPASGSLRPRVGDPVVSGWLRGRCPFCSQHLVGFFCETCGGHFSPSEMQGPGTAHFDGQVEFRDRASLFLRLPGGADAISKEMARIRVRPDFVEIAERYLRRQGASIRLTVPSPWGLELEMPGLPAGEVIWSYSALLYGCHLVAGERYRELTGATQNPLERGSDVTCVLSFGIDNAVPFLVGATGCALGQDKYKPLDGLLVNYFYDLDGAKFSTSRDHVIWGGDIVKLGQADADLVRAYLATVNPEFGRNSFSLDGFLEFQNEQARRLHAIVEDAFQVAAAGHALDAGVARYLEQDLLAQQRALSLATFDLAAAYEPLGRWLERSQALTATPQAALSWLAGLALLAAPFLPRLAEVVWQRLGIDGPIFISRVLGQPGPLSTELRAGSLPLRQTALARAEFNACLPAHLRR